MALIPSPYKPSRFISPLRARQLHRALKNFKLTIICGLLTIVVLRGALGAGKFGTPAKDFEEIKYQFERVHSFHARKHASRVLTEVIEERHRPLEAIAAQAHSDVPEDVKAQSNDEAQGKYALIDVNLDAKSTFDLAKPYAMSPDISDWDVQRRAWVRTSQNRFATKPKMMLVTGYQPSACENPTGDHYLLKFVKNKIDYCKLHGIEVLYNSAVFEAELSGLSAKSHLLRKLMLTHPEVEWFWWMDSNALFMDMAFELPLEKYLNYNVVVHGSDDMIYKQKTRLGLASGSFLIRNCQWSLNMLDTWVHAEGKTGVEVGELLVKSRLGQSNSHSQPMFAHLLLDEKRNLGERVPLEKLIFVHGYWEMPVKQSEEEMKKNVNGVGVESRPFAARFAGHELCKKGAPNSGDYNADLYFKYMERALDSADSQVLQLNSLQQKSASVSALRRLRGGHGSVMVSSSDGLPSLPDQSTHINLSSI